MTPSYSGNGEPLFFSIIHTMLGNILKFAGLLALLAVTSTKLNVTRKRTPVRLCTRTVSFAASIAALMCLTMQVTEHPWLTP